MASQIRSHIEYLINTDLLHSRAHFMVNIYEN